MNKKFMDSVLITLFVTTLIFIIVILIIFCFKDVYPEVLVQCYFNAVFGEAGVMGVITVAKKLLEKKSDNVGE